jgi:uncharacterized protein
MSNQVADASPVLVLERFYAEERLYMQAGGPSAGASFDGIATTLSAEVVLHQSPDLPWGRTYHGHAGFRDWATRMSDAFDYLDVRDLAYAESGTNVLVIFQFVVRSRRHQNMVEHPMMQVVSVKGGKIIEFRPFYWNVPDYVSAATDHN